MKVNAPGPYQVRVSGVIKVHFVKDIIQVFIR